MSGMLAVSALTGTVAPSDETLSALFLHILAPRAAVSSAKALNLSPYTTAGIAALLVYDWFLTVEQEIKYVWNGPWSLGKILFLANRYPPFVSTFISLQLLTDVNSPEACFRRYRVGTWFIVLGTLVSEGVLMLRTYAIWGRKRWVRIVLICVSILLYPPAIAVTQLELQSLRYVSASYPGERGCFLSHASSVIYVAYILLGLSETTIFILTVVKARQHLRATRSPMVKMLYQQGIVYFFFILLATIANIIVPVTFTGETNWLATPQHVIHSLLCTRVLLFILRSRHSSNIRLASSSASRIQTATFTGKVTALFSTVWGPGDDSNDGLDGPGLMDDSFNDRDGSYGDDEMPDEGGSEDPHASRRMGSGSGRGGRRDDEHFELENLAPSPSPGYADGFSSPRTYEEPDSAKQLMWSNSVASSSRSRT